MTTAAKRRPVIPILVVVLLIPPIYSVVARGASGERDPSTIPVIEADEGVTCIAPLKTMRFRHMDILKEMRIDGVRDGNRGYKPSPKEPRTDYTFDDCRKCHESRAAFCDRCHLAVNLIPDCFGCHYYEEPGDG
jgi:hypothetical protein